MSADPANLHQAIVAVRLLGSATTEDRLNFIAVVNIDQILIQGVCIVSRRLASLRKDIVGDVAQVGSRLLLESSMVV